MNQPPRELFVAERPVRSDFSRSDFSQERSYARRRRITLVVLALAAGGIVYALWGHAPLNPADIPTIKAEGVYKQKPANPGGIDIPHQDVRVYDELEGKNAPPAPVEHLLPPPENPVQIPPPAPAPSSNAASNPSQTQRVERNEAAVAPPAPVHMETQSRPVAPVHTETQSRPVAPVASPSQPQASAPMPAPVANVEATPALASIDQVIANTKTLTAAPQPKAAPASGDFAVQLASVPDEAKAQAMLLDLQKKYASILGGTALHLARADLGAKGVYYRIQSQSLSQDTANHLCSSFKEINAGCILVRK